MDRSKNGCASEPLGVKGNRGKNEKENAFKNLFSLWDFAAIGGANGIPVFGG